MSVVSVPPLVFVRHGETDWNAEGRLQGQRDIPLNDKGRGQALRNGQTIARLVPEAAKFAFVASPLWRARETMEIVRGAMGLDPKAYDIDPRLLEITFGELEGFTYQEVENRNPGWLQSRDSNKWEFLPPGGESYQMLSVRIISWLETVREPLVVVAHGGVFRVLRHLVEGAPRAQVLNWAPPQGAVAQFSRGGMALYSAENTWDVELD